MALDVGTGGNNGRIPVEAHDHIANIDGFIAELAAFAGGESFFLGRYLSERADGNIILSQDPLRELGVPTKAGFLGLTLHLDDLANDFLVARVHDGSRTNGYMLPRRRSPCYQNGQH